MNHTQEAKRLLADAISDECVKSPAGFNASTLLTQRAQVHATLALAEQQRIANLIALRYYEGEGCSADLQANEALTEEADNGTRQLRPEIAEALGLGATK